MAILYFSDVLKKVGLDPSKVKLIRHALTDKGFRDCYEKNMVLEYTRRQRLGFSKGYDYWCVFISDKGTLAKFLSCYKVIGAVPDTSDVMPRGYPHPESFRGDGSYFSLKYIDLLEEYEGKLTIDWGSSTRMWHQKGTTEKPIISIQANEKKVFSGFENLILTYDELKEIISNPTIYEAWHIALSSVNAIYLIVDRDGHNKRMKELMCAYPERYRYFQFSILQILPKTVTDDEVIQTETLYKKKLLTIPFGLNDN